MATTRDSGAGAEGGGGRRLPRVSPWRKALVAASVVIAVVGLGLWGYAAVTSGDRAPVVAGAGTEREVQRDGAPERAIAPQGFLPGEPRRPTGEPQDGEAAEAGEREPSPLEVWSPAVFRLGFSFFAGFCIAYALRAFMKITLVVIGAGLLGLFGLQYAGLIDVNWGAVEGVYNGVAGWVSAQTESFSRFVSGYLPSAASGAAGFAAGFTTRR